MGDVVGVKRAGETVFFRHSKVKTWDPKLMEVSNEAKALKQDEQWKLWKLEKFLSSKVKTWGLKGFEVSAEVKALKGFEV